MKIHLSPRTAGRYGGRLSGNLGYVYQIIQNALDGAGFESSFDELWLTINYPPMYVLPGVTGIEGDFKKYYETLPSSFINRKYKKIDVNLKAPEFSENLDKAEQAGYQHKFDIDNKYKNLSETELATILVDKYLEAGTIIFSKTEKTDAFDFELFKTTLQSLQKQITTAFLESENIRIAEEIRSETIKRAIALREERKQTNKVKDKRIRDFRVYYDKLPNKSLYPYDYLYAEIFKNILRKKELMCPVYHHLYIRVGKTMEDCLLNSFSLENWYAYGLSVIDYESYIKQSETEKEQTVFNVIVNGLWDLANIDNLDKVMIEETIDLIKQKGLNTELEYLTVENTKYKLTISYFSRSMEEECPIYFNLLEKASNIYKRIEIGKARNDQIYLWLQKVTMTNTQIKVKSSSSIEADVYLKDKTRSMEFNIKDFLNG